MERKIVLTTDISGRGDLLVPTYTSTKWSWHQTLS